MQSNIEITKEIIDQIIFGMENQDNRFFLDAENLTVVKAEDIGEENGSNYYEIPEWRSVDGFNLMERFVSELKNPLAKQELHKVLQSGRGVFRNFKNVLKEYREVERYWYQYKDAEMKKQVLRWFNGVRESRGLEALSDDYFEPEDLILSDFSISEVSEEEDFSRIVLLDKQAFGEKYEDPIEAAYWYSFKRDHLPQPQDEEQGCFVLGIYTPEGEMAGFIWTLHDELDEKRTVTHILQLYVLPQYRGLGIGTTLVEEYMAKVKNEGIWSISLENPGDAAFLIPMLEQLGFTENIRHYMWRA